VATLTIKNLPDALYRQLKARAAENRRSINSEAILAGERALLETRVVDPVKMLAKLRRSQAQLKHIHLTDEILREARTTGRA
jgi:plasmid stability protein